MSRRPAAWTAGNAVLVRSWPRLSSCGASSAAQRVRRREIPKHHHDREMIRGAGPQPGTGQPRRRRIPRWLHPGRRRITDHAGPRSPPDHRNGRYARSRLTRLRCSLTAPLCTARIEHCVAHIRPGAGSRLPPACWPVYRTCRIEDVASSHTNTLICMLLTMADDRIEGLL
jgi:hypothetical protein